MEKFLLFICSILLTGISFAQLNTSNSSTLIKEGTSLHDQGKYEAAIKKYNQVLLSDKDNLLALAEKAYSLMALQEYSQAISACKKALKLSSNSPALELVYTTYGNALDLSGKPKNAVKIYNKGLKAFPDFYSLYYNKGVTLSGLNNIDGAIEAFENSATANPSHSSSFLALGRMLEMQKKNIPAFLSYLRFHIIEPDSKRAKENFKIVQNLVFSNVKKTGENSISINIPVSAVADLENKKKKPENSFRSIELILSMQSALDLGENTENKTEVERFEEKISSMFEVMEESKKENSGFYWEFVAPYFMKLHKENFEKIVAYLVFSNQDEPEINDWISNNNGKILDFYEWSNEYKWK